MAEALALALTGIVLVPLLQLVKRYTHLQGAPMIWLAFLVSLFTGGLASVWTGAETWAVFADPLKLFGSGSVVFAVAQVVYRTLKEKLAL